MSGLSNVILAASSSSESTELLTAMIEAGTHQTLPLPDGPVIGRWDLATLAHKAERAAEDAMRRAIIQALSDGGRSSSPSWTVQRHCEVQLRVTSISPPFQSKWNLPSFAVPIVKFVRER